MGNTNNKNKPGSNLKLVKNTNINNPTNLIAKLMMVNSSNSSSLTNLTVSLADVELEYMTNYLETSTGGILGICINNNKKGLVIMESIVNPIDLFLCEKINISSEYGNILFSTCTGFDNDANKLLKINIDPNTEIYHRPNKSNKSKPNIEKIPSDKSNSLIRSSKFKNLFDLKCCIDIVMDFSNVVLVGPNVCALDIKCISIIFACDINV